MSELRPSDLVDDTFPDSTAPPSSRANSSCIVPTPALAVPII